MIEADFAWLKQHAGPADARLADISAQSGGLAIQGPKSREVPDSLAQSVPRHDQVVNIPGQELKPHHGDTETLRKVRKTP